MVIYVYVHMLSLHIHTRTYIYIYIYTLDLMYNIDIYTYDKQLEQPVHRDLETYIHIHMYVCMLILELVERLHLKILHMHVDSCTNRRDNEELHRHAKVQPLALMAIFRITSGVREPGRHKVEVTKAKMNMSIGIYKYIHMSAFACVHMHNTCMYECIHALTL